MTCECGNLFCDCILYEPTDKGIAQFYANNTGIPGTLRSVKPTRTRDPTRFNDLFLRSHNLPYANEEYKQMKGAEILPGENIRRHNLHTLLGEETRPAEKCGCGATPNSKIIRR